MNIEQLKELIDSQIKSNGQQSINGSVLNQVLTAMVDVLSASVAIYGTTTFQEIGAAYLQGKILYCKQGNILYHLVSWSNQYAYYVTITNLPNGAQGSWVRCDKFSQWTTGTFTL